MKVGDITTLSFIPTALEFNIKFIYLKFRFFNIILFLRLFRTSERRNALLTHLVFITAPDAFDIGARCEVAVQSHVNLQAYPATAVAAADVRTRTFAEYDDVIAGFNGDAADAGRTRPEAARRQHEIDLKDD